MSALFARAVVVPVWMIVVALIMVLAPGGPRLRDFVLLLGLALVASALLALGASVIRAWVPRTLQRDAQSTARPPVRRGTCGPA
jgi:uncharacterized membrane protein